MPPVKRSVWPAVARYACAFISVAAAWGIQSLMEPSGAVVTSVFTAAVMVSTWFGEIGPGLVATLLSGLCIGVLFLQPVQEANPARDHAVRMLLFVGAASLIGWLHHLTKRSQQQLAEANRAKEQFLAMLSHELRNPLAPVLALASAHEGDAATPELLRGDWTIIRRNIQFEVRLIDDLLDLNRLSARKLELRLSEENIPRLLEDVVETLRPDIQAGGLKLVYTCATPVAWVRGDQVRLRQVIWNLLRNAMKFTPRGGRITVECERQNDNVSIRISDSGIGIPAEVMPRIFDPFEQSSQPAVRRGGGLGLGLAIARMIVEAHGGQIRAFSEGEGKGAAFNVLLPLSRAPAEGDGGPSAVPQASPPRSLKILLVEDHLDGARVIRQLLQRDGHSVQLAETMANALGLAMTNRFDLIISDLGLPDGSGLDLVKRLLKLCPALPAIAMSGYGTEKDLEASSSAGFRLHLVKPISLDDLRRAITTVMS